MVGSPTSVSRSRAARWARALPIAAAVVAVLAGCTVFGPRTTAPHTPNAADSGQPGTNASGQPSTSPSTSDAPSSTPTPTATPTPVTASCSQLWTDQQVFDANPNFTADDSYSPASGSLAAQLVSQQQGVACGWTNETSKSVIEIAVAEPAHSQLTQLSGAAAESYQVVPTYGTAPAITGYFLASAHTAQVFTGKYWVVVDCKDWQEPGDAAVVVADVLKNLS